jgi:DnaJ family protein C protein 3
MAKALGKEALPAGVVPLRKSVRRRELYHAVCKAYVEMGLPRKAETWCEEILRMEGGDSDLDAHIGLGEACLVKEEWESAVRHFQNAFDASGKSNSDVSFFLLRPAIDVVIDVSSSFISGFKKHNDC